jgi:hypothetical protein
MFKSISMGACEIISLIHSLNKAQVEDNGHLDYLLLDEKVRAVNFYLNVIFIVNNEGLLNGFILFVSLFGLLTN